jgi:hypothetical protein
MAHFIPDFWRFIPDFWHFVGKSLCPRATARTIAPVFCLKDNPAASAPTLKQ